MGEWQSKALIPQLAVFMVANVLQLPVLGQVSAPRVSQQSFAHPVTAQAPANVQSAPTPAMPQTTTLELTRVGSFKVLWAALESSGLAATLAGAGPFTVFAPTDQAFAALPAGTLAELLKPENKAVLVKILTYHVVPTSVAASALQPGILKTVEGNPVQIAIDPADKQAKVNTAKVVLPNVQASNGVIHVVDQVILPPNILDPPKGE